LVSGFKKLQNKITTGSGVSKIFIAPIRFLKEQTKNHWLWVGSLTDSWILLQAPTSRTSRVFENTHESKETRNTGFGFWKIRIKITAGSEVLKMFKEPARTHQLGKTGFVSS
jgi:transposase